jgi:sugar phosphate isomerase/epimerase
MLQGERFMKISQVAAQLYTVRDLCKTPADTAKTLKKVRKIGYTAVQVSGVCAMPEADLVAMLGDAGLVCCATHEPGADILKDPKRVAARVRALGCTITAYPYPSGVTLKTRAQVAAFAKKLDAAGKSMRAEGVTLCYHNHHMEFQRIGGRTILESLYALTNPRHLQGEPDTYWVQFGGGDPVDWCQRLKGRLPIIHLKDYRVTAENQVTYAEIGNGNLPWKRIIAAAEAAGCVWYCVEQDTCPGDPLKSLSQSFAYIRDHLCA